jgi:hypothetical protein
MGFMDDATKKKPLLRGIKIFGILLIAASVWQLRSAVICGKTGAYEQMFWYMSFPLLKLRFFVTIALRGMGLVCAVGILERREFSRKLLIALACFSLATLFWKHPFSAIEQYVWFLADILPRHMGWPMLSDRVISQMVVPVFAVLNATDLLFSVAVIRYFTHPSVKSWFVPSSGQAHA